MPTPLIYVPAHPMNDMQLAIRFTTEGGKVVVRDVRDMSEALQDTNTKLKQTQGAGQSAKAGLDQAKRGTNELTKGTRAVSKDIQDLKDHLTAMVGVGAVFYAALSAAGKVKDFAHLADDFNVLQTRVQTATKATGDYNEVSKTMYAIAQQNGAALDSTVELFQRMSTARKDLQATNEQMLNFTDAVQKLGIIGGSSTDAMKNGLLQLSQGLGGGVVRAEEFNSVLENIPELANRIASGFDKTTGQLRLQVLEGKLLSRDVLDVILQQLPQINADMAAIPLSLGRAGQTFDNAMGMALSRLDQATGATQTWAALLVGAATTLDEMDASELQNATAAITALAGGGAALLILSKYGVGLAAVAVGAGKLVTGLRAWYVNQTAVNRTVYNANLMMTQTVPVANRATVAVNLLNAAGKGLRSTLALLGGPAGIALLAGYAIYEYLNATEDAIDPTKELTNKVEGLNSAMSELNPFASFTKAKAEASLALYQGQLDFAVQLLQEARQRMHARPDDKVALHYFDAAQGKVDALSKKIQFLEQRLGQLNEQQGKTSTGTDEVNKELQKLLDTLYPAQAAMTKYTAEHELLEQAHKSGLLSWGAYMEAATLLTGKYAELTAEQKKAEKQQDKNTAANADYIKQLREELGLTKYQGRELAVQTALRRLNADATADQAREVADLARQLYDAQQQVDDWGQAWVSAFERIDSSFSDAWFEALSGRADDAFDDILDAFKRTLAEMLHLAITRPIVLQIQQAIMPMLGLGSGGLAGTALSGASAASSLGGLAGLGGLLGGSGIGNALASGGLWLGHNAGIYTNTWGNTLFSGAGRYANWQYGAAGILGGLFGGTAGGQGALGGSLGSAIGLAAGGPIGAAVGAVLGGAFGSLFGGNWKQHKVEARLQYGGSDFDGEIWSQERKKKLWKYRYRDESSEISDDPINAIFDQVEASILYAADQFDIESVTTRLTTRFNEDFVGSWRQGWSQIVQDVETPIEEWLANFSRSTTINIKDMSQEEAEAAIADWVQSVTDSMINQVFGSFLTDLQLEGEGLSDTLLRVSNNMQIMAGLAEQLNLTYDLTGKSAALAATGIVEMVGGLDALVALTGTYYQEFYSQQEQFDRLQQQLSTTFDELGLTLPQTHAGFRSLVEGLDLNTESGQELFAKLMQLVSTMDQYLDQVEAAKDATTGLGDGLNSVTAASAQWLASIQQQLDRIGLDGAALELYDLDKWYQEQINQAEELGASTTLLEQLHGRKRQAVIDKYLEQINADTAKQMDALAAEHERAVADVTSRFTQLFDAIRAASASLADSMLQVRRQGASWDEVGYQTGQISTLRGQLDSGTLEQQVELIGQLQSAIIARYDAQVTGLNDTIANHQAKLGEIQSAYEAISNAIAGFRSQVDDAVLAVRRAMPGWDEITHQAQRVAQLKGQLSSGSIEQRLSAADQLLDATNAWYDAQIAQQQELANAELERFNRLRDAISGLNEFASGLGTSNLSNLKSGDQLALLAAQYNDLLGKTQAGDANAAGKLQGVSSDYLTLLRDYYGAGSAEYNTLFNQVKDALGALDAPEESELPSEVLAHQTAVEQLQQAQLTELLGLQTLAQQLQQQADAQQQYESALTRAAIASAQSALVDVQQQALTELQDLQTLLDELNSQAIIEQTSALDELQKAFEAKQDELKALQEQQIAELQAIAASNAEIAANSPPVINVEVVVTPPPPVVITVPQQKSTGVEQQPVQPKQPDPRPNVVSDPEIVRQLEQLNRTSEQQTRAFKDVSDRLDGGRRIA
ncbi:tape measure protein [Bowmanella denitrificans]|uniref:tape measure protein n=1 Tax=Bowmanella denitrificans TaxID=366582 RepID=UPI000C9C2DBB|nr:tape measure protein [Bowmanella denitrificans]